MKWIFPVIAALLFFGIGSIADYLFDPNDGIKKDLFLFGTFFVTFYFLAKAQQHFIKKEK